MQICMCRRSLFYFGLQIYDEKVVDMLLCIWYVRTSSLLLALYCGFRLSLYTCHTKSKQSVNNFLRRSRFAMSSAGCGSNTGGNAQRKRGFSLAHCAVAASPKKLKVPKIHELIFSAVPPPFPPTDAVRAKLFSGVELLMAIDVETNVLVPKLSSPPRWQASIFGHEIRVEDEQLSHMRVVQIGWTVGKRGGGTPNTQSRLINPSGFVVDSLAADKHGITHAHAVENGVGASVALADMFADAAKVDADGGVICGHHLAFDGSLIGKEMQLLGLHNMFSSWVNIVQKGICTMAPDIGHWVRNMTGINDMPRSIPMRLDDLIKTLLPEYKELLANHHDAGTDSHMHWLVASELLRRVD